jgi:small subunit ribosomal protein S16
MAVKIRLARSGSRNEPFYRIVVAPSRSPRDGNFIERIGSYAPCMPKDAPNRVVVAEDRARYWLSVGAQPTERVALFLSRVGVIDAPVLPPRPVKSKPKKKAQERAQKKAEAAAGEATA